MVLTEVLALLDPFELWLHQQNQKLITFKLNNLPFETRMILTKLKQIELVSVEKKTSVGLLKRKLLTKANSFRQRQPESVQLKKQKNDVSVE